TSRRKGAVAANEFAFVDTAIGGAYNRNHVKRIDKFNPPPGTQDCYTTCLRFTDELLSYTQSNRKTGKPSVSGYPGPALALFLPFDLDCGEDPTRALIDARRVVQHWMAQYDVPAKAIRVFFSGCKGFSVELPATLFGGFEPSVDVAERLKRLAACLGEGAETLDTTIYEKLRLWRWPNTINSKTRLYKVPLTVEELLALDLTAIKRLAVSPRQIEWPPDDEWQVNPELQALWMGTPEPTIARPARLGTQADDDGQKILKGNRNARLTSLAGTMRRRGMGEAAIAAALLETNAAQCDPPLDEAEIRRIAASVARYEAAEANRDCTPEKARDGEHLTDLGNARRLVKRHGRDLRYVRLWRAWLYWDGRRWVKDTTGEVERRAKETVASIYAEASASADEDLRKKLANHAMQSESAHRIEAMIRLAESEPEVVVTPEQLDADPWLLNVQNGTVDLRTGRLRPHQWEDLLTKLDPVDCQAGAACPTFEAFLDRIFAGDRDLIGFVQRAAGYSLTGDVSERVLFILHGIGANGKTTLQEVLRAACGDYAMRTPTETLLVKREGGIPNDVARLVGARFVTASEADDGKRMAEALVKDMTGGDTITARFMRAEFFEFRPQFKVWLATNHKPVIRGTDKGIWDRIRLVPFNVRIPDAEQDKQLLAKLRDELPGILRWAIEGCLAWQREGLGAPQAVKAATEDYRQEMDVLGRFIEESCLVDSSATVKSSALYEAYKKWCEANREFAVTQKAFSLRLVERGFTKTHHETGWWWYGIGLLTGQANLTGADGLFHMSDMNPSRIASYEKTRHDPSDPSAPDPLPNVNAEADRLIATALTCSKTNGLTPDLPAEGIGSADDL
ncbi:MAG: hypothetical protein DMF90_21760, partial [Acidobacteria bacterium]